MLSDGEITQSPQRVTLQVIGTPDATGTYESMVFGEEAYRVNATLQAGSGGVTFEPYPTWRAQQIGFATELAATLTAVAASPTPIPPLPFDAKWLIKGVVAELPGDYVEREIFSLYRKTWALLSFQSEPPTEDFAQQLGEYMWQGTETEEAAVNAIVAGDGLAGCTYGAIVRSVEARLKGNRYLRIANTDFAGATWRTFSSYDWYQGVADAPYPTKELTDRGYVESYRNLYLVGLVPAAASIGGTVTGTFETVNTSTGAVEQAEKFQSVEMGLGFRSRLFAIWVPELSGWRLARLASPYCE